MKEKFLLLLQRGSKHVAGVFTSDGLYATCFPRDTPEDAILAVNGFDLSEIQNDEFAEVLEIVFDIYEGKRDVDKSKIKFDFADLTSKQILVYKAAMNIPYGHMMSYGIVAEYAGLPRAARFVGNVMATNRMAPIVPCHRVVAANGLGGYGEGIERKIELLKREGAFAE